MTKVIKLHPQRSRKTNLITEAYALVDDDDYDEMMQYEWYFKPDNRYQGDRAHISVGRNHTEREKAYAQLMDKEEGSLMMMNHQILRIYTNQPIYFLDKDQCNHQKANLWTRLDGIRYTGWEWRWLYDRVELGQIDKDKFAIFVELAELARKVRYGKLPDKEDTDATTD